MAEDTAGARSREASPSRSAAFARGTPLAPVFLALRVSLHTLVTGLLALVVLRALALDQHQLPWIVALAIVVQVTYISGAFLLRSSPSQVAQLSWLAVITAQVLTLVALTPEAGFLVFPLFFLQLHGLSTRVGIVVVAISTVFTVTALALHTGWNVGGVLGPTIGAGVAVAIGLGYRALFRETEERQQLINDLLETRHELALQERETGVLAERERLAREIHDTVAQGLSSIQLLLHAAERGGPDATTHLRMAREAAGTNLAEARRFIRELTPPSLQENTLPGALDRLALSSSTDFLTVAFHVVGEPAELPMRIETALLRIAQASLANVAQHARASRAEITLTFLDEWVGLDVVDDGVGFDTRTAGGTTSFGLIGLRSRVAELGGILSIESTPGGGTAIATSFELNNANGGAP